MFETIIYEHENKIARIYLNRPERLNAVNEQLVEEFCQAIDQSITEEAKLLIVSGKGRAFCAGFDLKQNEEIISKEEEKRKFERIQDVAKKIRNANFPVIANVHGYALGAGCEFALSCDLIYATDDAEFGFPEVSVGLSIGCGISHDLPKIVGPAKAKELLFFSNRISSFEAKKMGLINHIFQKEYLNKEINKNANELIKRPTAALTKAKVLLNKGIQSDIESAYKLETEHAVSLVMSNEAKNRAKAFQNK